MNLKISNLLNKVAFKLRQKALYFELKHYIVCKKSYLKHIHSYERSIGKTYSLIQLAHKYNCPIVVKFKSQGDLIKKMSRDLFKKDIEVMCANDDIRGRKFELVLCEEGLDVNFVNEVLRPMSECVVGYVEV